jgi:hypothetical protein
MDVGEGIEGEAMSEDKPETFSVHVTQQDYGVIRASLIHSYEFWKHVVETGEYPEYFDEGKAKELILMNQEVLEKINLILTMKPISSHNVGVT